MCILKRSKTAFYRIGGQARAIAHSQDGVFLVCGLKSSYVRNQYCVQNCALVSRERIAQFCDYVPVKQTILALYQSLFLRVDHFIQNLGFNDVSRTDRGQKITVCTDISLADLLEHLRGERNRGTLLHPV